MGKLAARRQSSAAFVVFGVGLLGSISLGVYSCIRPTSRPAPKADSSLEPLAQLAARLSKVTKAQEAALLEAKQKIEALRLRVEATRLGSRALMKTPALGTNALSTETPEEQRRYVPFVFVARTSLSSCG